MAISKPDKRTVLKEILEKGKQKGKLTTKEIFDIMGEIDFEPEQLELVASVKSEEYYIKMMVAWYFATALAKQYEAALPYIEGRKLECWVHNKTIQKAVESNRVSDEHKD